MVLCCINNPPLSLFVTHNKRSHSKLVLFFRYLNGNNIVGNVPSNFSFHIGKVRKDDGSFSMQDAMLAVDDCVAAGAKVISLAISCLGDTSGKGCYKKWWKAQFDYIYNQGVLIVAAAGNTGSVSMEYPGAYKTVLSVSAVKQNRLWFEESTQNDQIEIAAPGV
jgi:serine protease